MDFVYYILLVAVLLLFNISKIEAALFKHDSNKQKADELIEPINVYAHSLVMETGEILSRPVNKRFPDMEFNQQKVKLYYSRLNSAPVKIHAVNNEKTKPILMSVN